MERTQRPSCVDSSKISRPPEQDNGAPVRTLKIANIGAFVCTGEKSQCRAWRSCWKSVALRIARFGTVPFQHRRGEAFFNQRETRRKEKSRQDRGFPCKPHCLRTKPTAWMRWKTRKSPIQG